jgi:hypothetical protein
MHFEKLEDTSEYIHEVFDSEFERILRVPEDFFLFSLDIIDSFKCFVVGK